MSRLSSALTKHPVQTAVGVLGTVLTVLSLPSVPGDVAGWAGWLAWIGNGPARWLMPLVGGFILGAIGSHAFANWRSRRAIESAASAGGAGLLNAYADWLRAKRAALPDWPQAGTVRGALPMASAAYQDYDAKQREANRRARTEYQEIYRAPVMDVLGETECASEPHTIKDLEAIEQRLRLAIEGGLGVSEAPSIGSASADAGEDDHRRFDSRLRNEERKGWELREQIGADRFAMTDALPDGYEAKVNLWTERAFNMLSAAGQYKAATEFIAPVPEPLMASVIGHGTESERLRRLLKVRAERLGALADRLAREPPVLAPADSAAA